MEPFLAMTAAEIRNISVFPGKIAWMACHFSPFGLGLSNLPRALPVGSLLMVDDVTPPRRHDPVFIAEQISAVEQSREINVEILRRYLPNESYTTQPIKGDTQSDYNDMATERELLYKILFDMRSDINDLKRMMMEAMRGNVTHSAPTERREEMMLPALPAHPTNEVNYDYDVVEDDSDEPMHELTKEEVQREQIVQALQKHGYRRKDAARELFISERTLYRRMKALGIDDDTKL
jgi:DNA-binding NarL/FixJ family response regulator